MVKTISQMGGEKEFVAINLSLILSSEYYKLDFDICLVSILWM
jgi:hypothetical protein